MYVPTRPTTHRSLRHCSADIQRMSSQGFCAAVPEAHLEILKKNTTDIDYIGMCCRLCSTQGPFLIASNPQSPKVFPIGYNLYYLRAVEIRCKWQPETSRECLRYLLPPFVSIILVLRHSSIKSFNTHQTHLHPGVVCV
jgi:hypothetical protein